jgi:hypothetical protein
VAGLVILPVVVAGGDGGDLAAGRVQDDQLRAAAFGQGLRSGQVHVRPRPGAGVGGGQGSGDVVAGLVPLGGDQTAGLAAHRQDGQHRQQRDRADADQDESGE